MKTTKQKKTKYKGYLFCLWYIYITPSSHDINFYKLSLNLSPGAALWVKLPYHTCECTSVNVPWPSSLCNPKTFNGVINNTTGVNSLSSLQSIELCYILSFCNVVFVVNLPSSRKETIKNIADFEIQSFCVHLI